MYENIDIYISYKYAVVFDQTQISDPEELRKLKLGGMRPATVEESEKFRALKQPKAKCKDLGIQVRKKKFRDVEFYNLKIKSQSLYYQLEKLRVEHDVPSLENVIEILILQDNRHKGDKPKRQRLELIDTLTKSFEITKKQRDEYEHLYLELLEKMKQNLKKNGAW